MENNKISIHALLAESDRVQTGVACRRVNFNPRSPCGERRRTPERNTRTAEISIHALLAESDDGPCQWGRGPQDFNPRSPCGERHYDPPRFAR